MSHTRGPWYRRGPLAEDESGVAGGVPVDVVAAPKEDDEAPLSILDDLTVADADLIAGAPDLLAVLKALVTYPPVREVLAPEHSLGSLVAAANHAIAKAEGRS